MCQSFVFRSRLLLIAQAAAFGNVHGVYKAPSGTWMCCRADQQMWIDTRAQHVFAVLYLDLVCGWILENELGENFYVGQVQQGPTP